MARLLKLSATFRHLLSAPCGDSWRDRPGAEGTPGQYTGRNGLPSGRIWGKKDKPTPQGCGGKDPLPSTGAGWGVGLPPHPHHLLPLGSRRKSNLLALGPSVWGWGALTTPVGGTEGHGRGEGGWGKTGSTHRTRRCSRRRRSSPRTTPRWRSEGPNNPPGQRPEPSRRRLQATAEQRGKRGGGREGRRLPGPEIWGRRAGLDPPAWRRSWAEEAPRVVMATAAAYGRISALCRAVGRCGGGKGGFRGHLREKRGLRARRTHVVPLGEVCVPPSSPLCGYRALPGIALVAQMWLLLSRRVFK